MRRLLAILPLFIAAQSGAQIIRRGSLGPPPPSAWVSAGAAVTQGFTIVDGSSGSRWAFGSGTTYQASLEQALSGFTLGVRGSTGRIPLSYGFPAPPSGTIGPVSTDADARVSQLLGTLRVAGGRGIYSVVELDAGATIFSDFHERTPTGAPFVNGSDADFSFGFGYGIGYGFSNRFTVEVVQDLSIVMHQRTGLSASDDSNVHLNSTRIVGRLGLGSKR